MSESRRDFLARTAAGLVGAAAAAPALASQTSAAAPQPAPTPAAAAGTPPAFGTAPPVGPPVGVATFTEAEKLVRVEMTPADLAQAAGNWSRAMAGVMERRTGPRKLPIPDPVAPASR